jgi:nicotinate phosphoribosyltransferase
MESVFTVRPDVLSGDTADVYFLRTKAVLEKENINPVVTMEIFPGRPGLLCGVKEVLALLQLVLPDTAKVWAMDEGEPIAAKQVAVRITAPYQSFGVYETAMLGTLAHCTGWATAARACVEAAQGIPVVSFGARHVHPNIAPTMDYAAMIGGCVTGSTTAGARLLGRKPSGTMPHALVLVMGDTVQAALAFDRDMPDDVTRIVLVDTFKDEAEESLRVAHALGKRLGGVRLDTPMERGRVTPDLVKEVRARLDMEGFSHVKVFISGGLSPDRIKLLLDAGAPVASFGVGSYISGASPIDFTGDLKEIDGKPIAKRGRIPGITANPRLKRVEFSATAK